MRLLVAVALVGALALVGYYGLEALFTAQANALAHQYSGMPATIPQTPMPEDKPTVARALQRLQSAAPNAYASLRDPEHPIVTAVDGLTKFTWADVTKPSEDSATVSGVSITLNEEGQLVGVDAGR